MSEKSEIIKTFCCEPNDQNQIRQLVRHGQTKSLKTRSVFFKVLSTLFDDLSKNPDSEPVYSSYELSELVNRLFSEVTINDYYIAEKHI